MTKIFSDDYKKSLSFAKLMSNPRVEECLEGLPEDSKKKVRAMLERYLESFLGTVDFAAKLHGGK